MQSLLEQTIEKTNRISGSNIMTIPGYVTMLSNDTSFNAYRDSLSEGLDEKQANLFKMLAENTRMDLLKENSMMQFNPYETLSIPILRKFFPRLIATQLVNTIPMDKPEITKYFLRGKFKKWTRTGTGGYDYEFPYYGDDAGPLGISKGPEYGISVAATSDRGGNPGVTTDILTLIGLTSTQAHIEKQFKITGATDSTGSFVVMETWADVDGNFSADVTTPGGDDLVSGHVDYLNGTFTWSSSTGNVSELQYQAIASLEENQINPTTKFEFEKIRIVAVDRKISAEWTLEFEQDVRALFDLPVQSQMVNMIGEQIALDIDKEIIGALIAENAAQNPASHTATFDINPPATFNYGPKQWQENIIQKLSVLSAQVHDSSQMGPANVIAANPLDAAILENINSYNFDGSAFDGGDLGYRSATVGGGKWKVLVSSIVPRNKMLMVYKSPDEQRAVYVYSPYVPTLLTPYPLGPIPSLTVMSRYGTKSLRPEGIALLNITDTSV